MESVRISNGETKKDKKSKATDKKLNTLDIALRTASKKLAVKIQPKVYKFGFLLK